MQIINQPFLSQTHSNKLLLTQWQFPNESINALTSTSFAVMLTFLYEESHPEWLYGRGLSSCRASCTHQNYSEQTQGHTHRHSLWTFSSAFTHAPTVRQKMISSPAALASPLTSIIACEQEHPQTAHWQLPCKGKMSGLLSNFNYNPWLSVEPTYSPVKKKAIKGLYAVL